MKRADYKRLLAGETIERQDGSTWRLVDVGKSQQTPHDLPPEYGWASQELVDNRLRIMELDREIIRLRGELTKVTGDSDWLLSYMLHIKP